ncbi:MAG: YegP family protein [Taibaiella sp.]|jgi:hypothetical protein
MGKFVIKKRTNDEYQFNLKAGNGEIILSSEGYSTKYACMDGIKSVMENASDDSRYDKLTTSNNKHYFNLKAGNAQVIGISEMYETASGRDSGIDSVKRNAPEAVIEDLAS